jgi:hypothetical protein
VMKILAVHNRGLRKDFYDIHMLLREGYSLARQIETTLHHVKEANEYTILRSLAGFNNANKDRGHYGYDISWDQVKEDIIRARREYMLARSKE